MVLGPLALKSSERNEELIKNTDYLALFHIFFGSESVYKVVSMF